MPLKCFVPGCNYGLPKQNKIYKQQEIKLPSVFHPPGVDFLYSSNTIGIQIYELKVPYTHIIHIKLHYLK